MLNGASVSSKISVALPLGNRVSVSVTVDVGTTVSVRGSVGTIVGGKVVGGSELGGAVVGTFVWGTGAALGGSCGRKMVVPQTKSPLSLCCVRNEIGMLRSVSKNFNS